MSTSTDAMLARLESELEQREIFINGITEQANRDTRDLKAEESEMVNRARERIGQISSQIENLGESARIIRDSRQHIGQIARAMEVESPRGEINYVSPGAYIIDRWRAGVGVREAVERLDMFHRAAAHQTTADNPGLIPEPILGPVINFIDAARPIVSALGPAPIPGGPTFNRPRVTQHTEVGPQAAEKGELVSRKMIIGRVPVSVTTYGGYVNVSRQDIDWSTPSVMDIIVNDLSGQYALETEQVVALLLGTAGNFVAGPVLPANPTAADVSGALWAAAATAYSNVLGQGRLILAVSPDMLGLFGPLFAPINPQNAYSTGFNAGGFGQGAMGAISGITVVMSAMLPAGSAYVLSTAAVEAYEQRLGTLQVTEPSVLGVQVAYAGYFGAVVLEDGGVVQITKGV